MRCHCSKCRFLDSLPHVRHTSCDTQPSGLRFLVHASATTREIAGSFFISESVHEFAAALDREADIMQKDEGR